MARRKNEPDLMGLTVLALLSVGPRHAWDLHRFILDTHKDFVTGLPRSLYHAVNRLANDELIEPVETAREGRRPERTVYQINDEGRAELGTRLRHLLATPSRDTTGFVAALSFLGCLAEVDVRRALTTRVAVLEGSAQSADQALAGLRDTGLPRLLLLELEFERDRTAAELAWVRGIIAELEQGAIDWNESLPSFS